MGGIQHIICSATMTIDNKGRVTPRQLKYMKKKGQLLSDQKSTMEALCELLKFRSKNPKVIDLTEETQGKMPATLTEYAARCKNEEKDLYMYYFLQQKKGESIIIFCNAITATRRLNSLLDFLKIKNFVLHSKMQQKQRIKNLERFKRSVNEIEAGDGSNTQSAILVCTDVAARGLDIPYVSNVVHYQCPFNAEVYVHRCGRTARIGRNGDSLSLITPEDNKQFKEICQVLKKTEDDIHMFEVKYGVLDKIRPLIDQAKTLEKGIHQRREMEKSAGWMIKTANEAEIEIDEDLQYELNEQLGSKAKKSGALSKSRLEDFKDSYDQHRKRESKQQQKDMELKKKYDAEIHA